MKPGLRKTFDWLKAQGLPPLPIAPAQDPQQYPAKERDGTLKRDQSGVLIAAFTGKNPSFLDVNGIPHLIRHTRYQHQLPTEQELRTWFTHPGNGIGTLGGWQHLVWLDVDVKQFASQDACNARVSQWLSQYPRLQQTFTERTHSGGWRFAVRVPEKCFTNFSLDGLGGQQTGEALGQGRFTVLAPTIGPSGQPYVNSQCVSPLWVERLEAIGVYPVSRRWGRPELTRPRPPIQVQPAQPGVLRLEDLATAKAQAVLHGESPLESRSHSLTYALREFYGWENWAAENGVLISGDAEALAREAGAALGIDAERVERIIQSIPDPDACLPATVFMGGEVNAWKQVWNLNQNVYYDCYPDSKKEELGKVAHKNISLSTTRDSQKGINSHLRQPSINWPIQQSPLRFDQIKQFARCALFLLEHHAKPQILNHQVTSDKKYSHQGRVYTVESEGETLSVKTNKRGIILKIERNTIQMAQVTAFDLQIFRAESRRVQQVREMSNTSPGLNLEPDL